MNLYTYYIITHFKDGGVKNMSEPKYVVAEDEKEASFKAHESLDRDSYATVSRPLLVETPR